LWPLTLYRDDGNENGNVYHSCHGIVWLGESKLSNSSENIVEVFGAPAYPGRKMPSYSVLAALVEAKRLSGLLYDTCAGLSPVSDLQLNDGPVTRCRCV
jgi:hypothetical protein